MVKEERGQKASPKKRNMRPMQCQAHSRAYLAAATQAPAARMTRLPAALSVLMLALCGDDAGPDENEEANNVKDESLEE